MLRVKNSKKQETAAKAAVFLYPAAGIEARFRIATAEDDVRMDLIGAELAGDYVLVYQEVAGQLPDEILIYDSILRDIYPAQINQVNIADGDSVHSLLFTADKDWHAYKFQHVHVSQ